MFETGNTENLPTSPTPTTAVDHAHGLISEYQQSLEGMSADDNRRPLFDYKLKLLKPQSEFCQSFSSPHDSVLEDTLNQYVFSTNPADRVRWRFAALERYSQSTRQQLDPQTYLTHAAAELTPPTQPPPPNPTIEELIPLLSESLTQYQNVEYDPLSRMRAQHTQEELTENLKLIQARLKSSSLQDRQLIAMIKFLFAWYPEDRYRLKANFT